MDQTERVGLPLLSAGQLQKEIWVNESLNLIDLLLSGRLVGQPLVGPPADAASLIWYQVGASATGAWSGHEGELAALTAGGWRFLQPFEGLELADSSNGSTWRFTSSGWEAGVGRMTELRIGGTKVVGERGAAIADPAGGSVVDGEARSAISSVLAALRTHGLIA